jgi:hypothetical protein
MNSAWWLKNWIMFPPTIRNGKYGCIGTVSATAV